MLSISTAWNYKAEMDAGRMLEQVRSVGLHSIELGYRITNPQLEAILPLLEQFQMSVSSVHNFCPVPFDGPSPRHPSNHYRLSAVDPEERQKAVYWTQRAVDTACRVKAGVVVIHAGTVEMENDLSSQLLKMCKLGNKDIREFQNLRDELLAARKKHRGPFMESLVAGLRSVMEYAQAKGIKVGLETRYYPTEMPNFEEIGEILALFHAQGMYYWHDVGHAEVNERLGITPHLDYLRTYEDKLIGFHIHGVKGLRDHQAPFDGDFDLRKVSAFIKKHHYKVIESHEGATGEQIREAVEKLRNNSLWNG